MVNIYVARAGMKSMNVVVEATTFPNPRNLCHGFYWYLLVQFVEFYLQGANQPLSYLVGTFTQNGIISVFFSKIKFEFLFVGAVFERCNYLLSTIAGRYLL